MFKPGEAVRLTYGGQIMTVDCVYPRDPEASALRPRPGVYCVWHDPNGHPCSATYQPEALVLIASLVELKYWRDKRIGIQKRAA